jgi:hypothetical protein
MRILMLENKQGSEDGLTVKEFLKDKEYDIGNKLGIIFIDNKWAIPVNKELKVDKIIIEDEKPENDIKHVTIDESEIIDIENEEEIEQKVEHNEVKSIEKPKVKIENTNKYKQNNNRFNRFKR